MEIKPDYILSDSESKELDAFSVGSINTTGEVLMSMASASIFSRYYLPYKNYKIIVIAGSGNNGGDGILLGTLFNNAGNETVVFYREGSHSKEYEFHKRIALSSGIVLQNIEIAPNYINSLRNEKVLIIDALLGTGSSGGLKGLYLQLAEILQEKQDASKDFRILNLDIPSGFSNDLDGFPIDIIAEIGVRKWKNLTARLKCREYSFHNIGFPTKKFINERQINNSIYWDSVPEENFLRLCKRKITSNKYKNGSILFVGGSKGMSGAILLSQQMFHSLGGGISCITTPSKNLIKKVLKSDPSILISEIPDKWDEFSFYKKADCLVVGPGLRLEDIPSEQSLLNRKIFTVLDAGILEAASHWSLHELCLLTPHDGELNRIAGKKIQSLEEKVEFAREFTIRKKTNLLLKGPIQILSTHEGKVFVRYCPNPKLAIMGTGDLFTGILGFFYTRTGDLVKSVRYSIQFMELSALHPKAHPNSYEILQFLAEKT